MLLVWQAGSLVLNRRQAGISPGLPAATIQAAAVP
jgi:hypothetical protein